MIYRCFIIYSRGLYMVHLYFIVNVHLQVLYTVYRRFTVMYMHEYNIQSIGASLLMYMHKYNIQYLLYTK